MIFILNNNCEHCWQQWQHFGEKGASQDYIIEHLYSIGNISILYITGPFVNILTSANWVDHFKF